LAFARLAAQPPPDDRLRALGALREAGTIRLPSLNQCLLVDPARQEVRAAGLGRAKRAWALLALHYLAAEDAAPEPREVSFGHFPDSRGYLAVFAQRIVARFLATAGRTPERFVGASAAGGGEPLAGPGLGYRFSVLPRVPLVIIRYAGDEEVGPAANFIYRADAERLLPAEDRVVAAELLVDVLCGKNMLASGDDHEKRH
jgi:hypothetical protein